MTSEELKKTLETILKRGNDRWNTPSGALIDLLRQFARDEKIESISEICKLYFSAYPGARSFVSRTLPAILVNNYRPLIDAADPNVFLKWSESDPEWAELISDNAAAPQLTNVVDDVVKAVREYSN